MIYHCFTCMHVDVSCMKLLFTTLMICKAEIRQKKPSNANVGTVIGAGHKQECIKGRPNQNTPFLLSCMVWRICLSTARPGPTRDSRGRCSDSQSPSSCFSLSETTLTNYLLPYLIPAEQEVKCCEIEYYGLSRTLTNGHT